jgi:predicted ArsR family transcriptional regulator
VLAALRASDHPLRVDEVAAAVGIAVPTAQFHLSILIGSGLAQRAPQRSGSAGRPSWGYLAADPAQASARASAGTGAGASGAADAPAPAYQELARVLAAELDGRDDAAAAARDAGRRWAGAMPSEGGPPRRPPDPEAAMASLSGVLGHLGFAPESRPAAGEILLRACPFEAVARVHRSVVCGVHLGLVEQAAAAIGGIAVDGLEPFRSTLPLTCAVRLRAPRRPAPATQGVP